MAQLETIGCSILNVGMTFTGLCATLSVLCIQNRQASDQPRSGRHFMIAYGLL